MRNPILNLLNQAGQARPQTPMNNPMAMLTQFQQFARGMTPQKAQQILMQKMSNGEISPQQFEQTKAQAKQFARMLGLK